MGRCARRAPTHTSSIPLDELECVLQDSEILVLAAPHKAYRGLEVGGRDVVDVWGAMGEGIRL